MSAPFHPPLIHWETDILIDGVWEDLDRVRYEDRMTIERGASPHANAPDPSSASFKINNQDGKYSFGNPMSELYDKLQYNHPMRINRRMIEATFPSITVDNWTSTKEGHTWTRFTSGGSSSNNQFQSPGGNIATHSVSVADAYRLSYLADPTYVNGEWVATFQMPVANITGGAVAVILNMRGQTTSARGVEFVVQINTDETISVQLYDDGVLQENVSSTIVHTGQAIRMCVGADLDTIRGKVWPANESEPDTWTVEAHSTVARLSGFVGALTSVQAGNTNAFPFVVTWSDFVFRSPRINGVIPNWPEEWDTTGLDGHVQIEAAGITRRLNKDTQPAISPLQRSVLQGADRDNCIAYWSCEDLKSATQIASSFPGTPPMLVTGTPTYAANSDFECSLPIPNMNSSKWVADIPPYTAVTNNYCMVRNLISVPSGGATAGAIIVQVFFTGGSIWYGEIVYQAAPNNIAIRFFDFDGVVIGGNSGVAITLDGSPARMQFSFNQDGADVQYQVYVVYAAGGPAGGHSSIVSSQTLGKINVIQYNPNQDLTNTAIGHISVHSDTTSLFDYLDELRAFTGETDGRRVERLCMENEIPFAYVGDLDDCQTLGPQGVDTVYNLLKATAEAGMGKLYESRSTRGYVYVTQRAMYGMDATATFDLSDKELSPGLTPSTETDRMFNDVTVQRTGGSEYRVTKEDGTAGATTIGRQPTRATLNVETDLQLPDSANWILHLSQNSGRLFRNIGTTMGNTAVSVNHVLSRAIVDTDLWNRIVITNGDSKKFFDDVSQLIAGSVETCDQFTHKFRWNSINEEPFHIAEWDDGISRYDSDTMTLAEALDTTETGIDVYFGLPNEKFSSDAGDLPCPIKINGERISVSAVTNTVPTFISVGAAAHADNASVTPGLPGGTSTTGDTMVMVACSEAFASTPQMPAGWTSIYDLGNVQIWGKIRGAAEAAPTVTLSGGIAGTTHSAQICALRNVSLLPQAQAQEFFGTFQDIWTPELVAVGGHSIVLYIGWKQDDWTSADAIPETTLIGSNPSAVGIDQGFIWSYENKIGGLNIPERFFRIIGGSSISTRGMVLQWTNPQTLTGARSQNQVVKGHDAGSYVYMGDTTYVGR